MEKLSMGKLKEILRLRHECNLSARQISRALNIRHTVVNRDVNASINIRNYGLGQTDNRNSAGTVDYACGVSSSVVTTSYGIVTSYDTMKQEA